ncbi:hypothetical protein R70723_11400 [Paenibacillus sp. FSL R7-0273]|uniref:hypothetical protein n=1 Tax=Paenibacillus sp. FSL R7-0273 TaxID=1536772 RepID=UPI0004F8CE08|nr:hypothetical protein [Paenibacillus sp. FSL R7-0273]AIQ46412.1 hypothetical protein R70723_11400 [Paenibacillus sp. FSL R7-0273]OMF86755.1 hypothetical protein BK144_25310 [Paenibacillus sp. FSL R7-0273]
MSAPTEAPAHKWRQLWQRRRWQLGSALLVLLVLLIVLAATLLNKQAHQEAFSGLPHRYEYLEAESPGKVQLHMLAVSPGDVVLRADGLPLRQIAAYGINGGFFYGTDLLSVAVMNDVPVNGDKGAYGSGWFNAKYARGTMVWDGAAGRLSVQTVSSGDELEVTDRSRYWAQGGISMNLQHEELWKAASQAEHLPFADEQRMRSGLVYDSDGKLWLIVTPTLCTAEAFRQAVLDAVPGEGREGIFLDGDGSSQLNADEAVLTGDSRPVVQMISVAGGK